jgi:hypothetical protein
VDVQIKPFAFESDLTAKGVTKENYIQVYRKIWATLRHDLYMSIQKWRAQNPRELTVPQKVCEQLYEEEFEHFETIRQEIFKLITGHDLD